MPSGFARILHLSPCYLSLWLIASANRPRYSGIGDIGRRNGVWEQPVSCDPMLIFWLTHMSDSSYIVPWTWKLHQLRTPTQCPDLDDRSKFNVRIICENIAAV